MAADPSAQLHCKIVGLGSFIDYPIVLAGGPDPTSNFVPLKVPQAGGPISREILFR